MMSLSPDVLAMLAFIRDVQDADPDAITLVFTDEDMRTLAEWVQARDWVHLHRYGDLHIEVTD